MAFITNWMIGFSVAAVMVICLECKTRNDDDAAYCFECGAKLGSKEENWEKRLEKWSEDLGKQTEEWGETLGKRAEKWGKDFSREAEKELNSFGTIIGLFFGAILILVAVAWIAGIEIAQYFGLFLVVFGLLIILLTSYNFLRKR